jgi:Cu+-exporting ATPase
MVGTGRGAQLGIVIKGGEVLESTRAIDTVVLDKTGTVTEGRMALVDAVPTAGVGRGELLRLAGSVEAASEHPIAAAIAAGAPDTSPVADFENRPGRGVVGTVDGRRVLVGRRLLFADVPADVVAAVDAAESAGRRGARRLVRRRPRRRGRRAGRRRRAGGGRHGEAHQPRRGGGAAGHGPRGGAAHR